MQVLGMASKSSPIQRASTLQRETIERLIAEHKKEGIARRFSVQHTPWVGHGCLADLDAITIDVDGRIDCFVLPDGSIRH